MTYGNNLSMLMIFFGLLFMLNSALLSQTLFGIDIVDPNNTEGYQYNSSNDGIGSETYLKNDPGVFDQILLIKGLGFICTINYPTLNRFNDVYSQLTGSYGFENDMFDSIPDASKYADISEKVFLIKDGKGQILRYWYEDKFNIKLIYNKESFKLYFSYF
ncbi:MAG: hypothetical protein K8I03_14670 [Ignavibacteria bacterium]|nr:hypothetical protein [Ignavibacteria bacterium]